MLSDKIISEHVQFCKITLRPLLQIQNDSFPVNSNFEGNGSKRVMFFISLCCLFGLNPFLLDAVSKYDLFSLANVYRAI